MSMFWDRAALVYDYFERAYNGKVYRATGKAVAEEIAPDDHVLECACGTGAISVCVAPLCAKLIATDFSNGMLKQTAKKVKRFTNVEVVRADIIKLDFADNSFDKVIAGNVIHLLDNPQAVVKELVRVCKPNGKVVVPTYINKKNSKSAKMAALLGKAGAGFKRQFDMESYQRFFSEVGYRNVAYRLVEGIMPCAIAVISVDNQSIQTI